MVNPVSTSRHTLWAGPEDGMEIEVSPGTREYRTPPMESVTNSALINREPPKQGLYLWSLSKQRFEWQGYVA